MARYVVAGVDELPPGTRKIVDVAGRQIGVFNIGGEFFALRNRCPHQGADLCRGDLVGLLESDGPGSYRFDPSHRLLVCPWHGWEFDVATGQSYFDPLRTRVRPFPVSVEDGRTVASGLEAPPSRVPGPYVAETIPIAVEEAYLVVTLGRAPAARPVSGGAA